MGTYSRATKLCSTRAFLRAEHLLIISSHLDWLQLCVHSVKLKRKRTGMQPVLCSYLSNYNLPPWMHRRPFICGECVLCVPVDRDRHPKPLWQSLFFRAITWKWDLKLFSYFPLWVVTIISLSSNDISLIELAEQTLNWFILYTVTVCCCLYCCLMGTVLWKRISPWGKDSLNQLTTWYMQECWG